MNSWTKAHIVTLIIGFSMMGASGVLGIIFYPDRCGVVRIPEEICFIPSDIGLIIGLVVILLSLYLISLDPTRQGSG